MPNTDKRVLVYQSYGRKDIIEQTLFSITSLFQKISDHRLIEVWVYTDQKETFEKFFGNKIKIRPVTLDVIEQLKGPLGFVHRVKPELLIAASREFRGPLFYIDSDTVFMADPTEAILKVNDRKSLMHISEGQIGQNKDILSKKIHRFIKSRTFDVAGETLTICPSTVMWNAGFVGISENNKSFLVKVLELTDRLYSQLQKHTMEQLAFSYILQTKTQIDPVDHVVLHYWDQKEDYQAEIQRFLGIHTNIDSALQGFSEFKFPEKRRKKKKNFLDRLKKIFGQKASEETSAKT